MKGEPVKQKKKEVIPFIKDILIKKIEDRLNEGKRVRRTLPLDGRLHIDRTLPFLLVYRRPHKHLEKGTSLLVKSEASYLIASTHPKQKPSLVKLIKTIVKTLSDKCQAFLIIEIWTGTYKPPEIEIIPNVPKPVFRVYASSLHPPTKAVEVLENSLKRIILLKQRATVEVMYSKNPFPAGVLPLISTAEAKKLNCYILALEIPPIYQNPINANIYPLVLQTLQRGLSRALKKCIYEFSHNQTILQPPNYLSLGRRAVVKAVWQVDKLIAQISHSFDFLHLVTPINVDSAWTKFRQSHYQKQPVLYYRPIPIDPAFLKRKLYQIGIERVEDPTLANLFREKRREIDRKLTMLLDIGTPAFLYGGLQLYGSIEDDLLEIAKKILSQITPRSRDEYSKHFLTAEEFAREARKEVEFYRKSFPGFSGDIQVREDTVGLMVARGNLLINKRIKIPQKRVQALLQHEVGTHMLTYFNGKAQPFQQLYCGMAGYEELQEGLAVLGEYLVGGMSRPRMRLLAGRVIAVDYLIKGSTFIETFRRLNQKYGFGKRMAFIITLRVYRGGGLIKDSIYLRGFITILEYMKKGGELGYLYIGKISEKHIPVIRELLFRKILQAAPLLPRYMEDPRTAEKMQCIKISKNLLNLI